MIDELTREKWNALFEVGGTDALWEAMEGQSSYRYTTGYNSGRRDTIKRYDNRVNLLNSIKAWSFSLLGVSLLIFAGYCVVQSQIRDGQKELAACASGNTSVCQRAAYDCSQLQTGHDKRSRLNLYLRTYKQATGRNLPRMEMEYGDK